MEINTVFLIDNLEFLKKLDSNIIDLIYIDPPFFSGVNYEEFNDQWKSLDDYLEFMEIRIRVKEKYRFLNRLSNLLLSPNFKLSKYFNNYVI